MKDSDSFVGGANFFKFLEWFSGFLYVNTKILPWGFFAWFRLKILNDYLDIL